MKKNSYHNQAGFTLIELMVALTLFTIVVMAAISSLYTVNNASKKVQAMRIVLDNLNFGMESMSRTIRTGSRFVCGGTQNQSGSNNCAYADTGTEGGQCLSLYSTLGRDAQIQYCLRFGADGRTGEIQKQTKDENGIWSNWVSMTAPEIDVQKLVFYVDGANETDDRQPSVMIFVEGVAGVGTENTAPFSIQTYVSQRATK